jgi:hypothetical protein
MEANLQETDESRRENDFRIISEELKRRFGLLMQVDDSHITKSGIILGFIMVIIVQITLTTEYTSVVMAKPVSSILFIIAFAAMLCSFCLGIVAVYPKQYDYGIDMERMKEQMENGTKKNYAKSVFDMAFTAYFNDKKIIENKSKFIRYMLWAFSFGLIFILLSRIVPW